MFELINIVIEYWKIKRECKIHDIERLYELTRETMIDFMEILNNIKNKLLSNEVGYDEALKHLMEFSENTSFKRIEIKSKVLSDSYINSIEGDLKIFIFSIIGVLQGGFHRRVIYRICQGVYDFNSMRFEYDSLIRCVDNIEFNDIVTEPYHTIKDIIERHDTERIMFKDPKNELIKDISFQITEISKAWTVCTHAYNNLVKGG